MKLFILPHFYKDEISGSSGERKSALNKTKKSKPRTTRIKMYACDACKYMATDINNLKLHKLESHTQPGKMCNIFVIVRCENMIFNWALPSLSPYITSIFSFFMSFLTFSFCHTCSMVPYRKVFWTFKLDARFQSATVSV